MLAIFRVWLATLREINMKHHRKLVVDFFL
jgi:hypothetical protein